MLFLMARMSATFVFSSLINENARGPLEVFRSIPSEGWGEELQRFFDQIKNETNCFGGKRLFYITRTVLFKLTGILITYELVLLQFDVADDDLNHLVDCTLNKKK
jgi:gustatory receptor